MAEDPLPVNTAAAQADKFIVAIENVLVPIAEAALIAQFPALGLPVIKQITQIIEQSVANTVTKLAETGVTFGIIDLQTDSEESNISNDLKQLEADEAAGKPIDADETKLQADQNSLVQDDGSVTPQ